MGKKKKKVKDFPKAKLKVGKKLKKTTVTDTRIDARKVSSVQEKVLWFYFVREPHMRFPECAEVVNSEETIQAHAIRFNIDAKKIMETVLY